MNAHRKSDAMSSIDNVISTTFCFDHCTSPFEGSGVDAYHAGHDSRYIKTEFCVGPNNEC